MDALQSIAESAQSEIPDDNFGSILKSIIKTQMQLADFVRRSASSFYELAYMYTKCKDIMNKALWMYKYKKDELDPFVNCIILLYTLENKLHGHSSCENVYRKVKSSCKRVFGYIEAISEEGINPKILQLDVEAYQNYLDEGMKLYNIVDNNYIEYATVIAKCDKICESIDSKQKDIGDSDENKDKKNKLHKVKNSMQDYVEKILLGDEEYNREIFDDNMKSWQESVAVQCYS